MTDPTTPPRLSERFKCGNPICSMCRFLRDPDPDVRKRGRDEFPEEYADMMIDLAKIRSDGVAPRILTFDEIFPDEETARLAARDKTPTIVGSPDWVLQNRIDSVPIKEGMYRKRDIEDYYWEEHADLIKQEFEERMEKTYRRESDAAL